MAATGLEGANLSPGAAPADPADVRLVLLAVAGDDGAFAELVAQHQARLRGFLRRLCGDPAIADDLAQAAFLKAWRNIAAVRDPAAFGPWLHRIAANAAIDVLRARGLITATLGEDEIAGPPSGVETADHRLDLEAALARLGVAPRACILLHHGEGLSHAEIAAQTGIPLGTVKSHIARATPLLRAWLAPWRPA